MGAFGVLLVSVVRRQLSWEGFVRSLYETLRTSCMVMFLIAGAAVFVAAVDDGQGGNAWYDRQPKSVQTDAAGRFR